METPASLKASVLALKNEADVREDIVTPFLRDLGYKRGTENDINRETLLRYEALQLGRKKTNDLPLRGKADYVLTVAGAGRWVLETKPPYEEIDLASVDQTISYSRHPEVSGHYAGITNGRRFILYDRSKSANDPPLIDLPVISGEALAIELEAVLGPVAIRRDCGPPKVDIAKGVAKGFRSRAEVLGGEVHHVDNQWEFPEGFPAEFAEQAKTSTQKIIGLISGIKGGQIWRDDTSRIRAKLQWSLPHEAMKSFMQNSGYEEFEYVCLDGVISDDPENPSVFEVLGAFKLEAGQPVFNVVQWEAAIAQVPVRVTINAQATGFLAGDVFAGIAKVRQTMEIPSAMAPIVFNSEVKFEVKVDTR